MNPHNEDSVYERLRAAILSLELVPGERFSERGLEPMLGASRTPIRAAVMRLENEGLTQREGRGWQVTPIDLAEVRAVMEYREAIEAAAVALAVERASDDDLDALGALAEEHRDRDDEATGLRDFTDFHLALTRLSRNQFLTDGMTGALTRLYRTRWLGVRTQESRSGVRDEHLRIIAAIRERDAGEAVALAVAHERGTRDRLLGYLTDERLRLRGRGFSIIESSAARSLAARSLAARSPEPGSRRRRTDRPAGGPPNGSGRVLGVTHERVP
jgi:DNA-binding GntR family transcriptional regulator